MRELRFSHLFGTSLLGGLLAGAAFWLACGPRFSTGMYASGRGWHSIEFSPLFTALIAAMLGVVVAVCVAAALWIARRIRRSQPEPR